MFDFKFSNNIRILTKRPVKIEKKGEITTLFANKKNADTSSAPSFDTIADSWATLGREFSKIESRFSDPNRQANYILLYSNRSGLP